MELGLRHVALSALVLVGTPSACLEPTEITLVLTTDEPCSALKGTAISVGELGADLEGKPIVATSTSCNDATHSLGKLVLVPSTTNREVGVRVVAGIGKSSDACIQDKLVGGCIVARRALGFVKHTSLTLPITIEKSCLDITCSPAETCVQGQCIDAHVQQCGGMPCVDGGAMPDAGNPAGTWQSLGNASINRMFSRGFFTGTEVWIWGGRDANQYFDNGLRYSQMQFGTIPSAMYGNSSVRPSCFGKKLVVWGGEPSTLEGKVFDGTSWTAMSNPSTFPGLAQFGGRQNHVISCAPDGSVVVIWGGWDVNVKPVKDGARYYPGTNTWQPMATSPLSARSFAASIWANGKVVIFGGRDGLPTDGATYDPVTDTWSAPLSSQRTREPCFATTDGNRAFFWGGDPINAETEITVIDPAGPSITIAGARSTDMQAPSPRKDARGWFSNNRLWVWGGATPGDAGPDTPLGDGASYDFGSKKWTPMPAGPAARSRHVIVWTGSEAIVYGGLGPGTTVFGDAWSFR